MYLNGYRDGNSVEASAKCLAFVAGDYELSPLLLLMMLLFSFIFYLERCDVLRKDNINSGAKEVAEEVGECVFGVEWGQGRRRTQLGAEEAASEE